MHKPIGLTSLMSFMIFLIGCSESNTIESTNENIQPQYDLVKADSIGIELGDSNYVFGAIIDAVYLVDGRIAILDILQRKILIFSGSGEFIGSAGRDGMGPGEFASPYSLTALSDGGFAVSDIQQGKITFFDSSLEYVKDLSGFQTMAPDRIRIGPNGSIFARIHNWY
ncbi:MAG: 6-bladed beta-propeller, partial [Candidatus Sabulitectum sp.]|nr:6-bladed beta-propeller [Candidatus Sabulitectum sp.]